MDGGKELEEVGVADLVEDVFKGVSTIPPAEPIDEVAERKLKWKIDLLILPMLCGTFFFSSMVSCTVFILLSYLNGVDRTTMGGCLLTI